MPSNDQSVVIVSKQRDLAVWLSNSLEGTAEVVPCQQTDLNDVLQLINMASASIVFIPVEKDTWQTDVRFIESLMAARPTLACVVLAESLDQERLLAVMRAGAKDYLTFASRPSDLAGLVRRLAERTPAVVSAPMQQGLMVTLASDRPVVHSAFHAMHLCAAIKAKDRDANVLLVDLGQPFAEAQQVFGLEGQFTFMDALRNLRRLDKTLVETTFPKHKAGVRVLSAPAEGIPLLDITTSEMYLLIGTLRSLFTHVVFNIAGLPTVDFTELLIGNSNNVVFPVDQSITSCRAGLDLVARLKEIGVPIASPMLLIDHYHAKVSPDDKAIARSFSMDDFIDLPEASELRLRAMNLGQLMFELAPQDLLSKQYRQWATLVCNTEDAKRVAEVHKTKPEEVSAGFLDKLKKSLSK